MPDLPVRTPSQILSDLFSRCPDAVSLLAEADHRRLLAYLSAAAARHSSLTLRVARRRLDDLERRLDPRHRRQVKARAGLATLAVIAACLLLLDAIELSGVMNAATLPLAVCATTTWLMAAWNGALADREARHALWTLIASGTVGLTLLIGTAHTMAVSSARAQLWDHVADSAIACALIDALTAGACALISRIEPMTVAAARASWRRARRRHRRAVRQKRLDAEAASIATETWLNLVRQHAIAAQSDFQADVRKTVQAALALATALVSLGRPAESERALPCSRDRGPLCRPERRRHLAYWFSRLGPGLAITAGDTICANPTMWA